MPTGPVGIFEYEYEYIHGCTTFSPLHFIYLLCTSVGGALNFLQSMTHIVTDFDSLCVIMIS